MVFSGAQAFLKPRAERVNGHVPVVAVKGHVAVTVADGHVAVADAVYERFIVTIRTAAVDDLFFRTMKVMVFTHLSFPVSSPW